MAVYIPEFTFSSGTAGKPVIAALSNGGFVAVWSINDGSGTGNDIRAQLMDGFGKPVGASFVVNSDIKLNEQTAPSVAATANGGFIVSWDDNTLIGGDDSGTSVRARVFNSDGSATGNSFLVSGDTFTTGPRASLITSTSQQGSDILAFSDGGYAVVYTEDFRAINDTHYGTYTGKRAVLRIYNADGTFKETVLPSDDPQFGGGFTFPKLALLDTGDLAVSWTRTYHSPDAAGYGDDVFVNVVKRPTGEITYTDWVNGPAAVGGNQNQSSIARLPNGAWVVAWHDAQSSLGDIYAQVYDQFGTELGARIRVNTTTTDTQSQPMVVSLADGRFVVAWTDGSVFEGQGFNVKIQVFSADQSRSGLEQVIHLSTDGNQRTPMMRVLQDGRILVTWSDTNGGLFGKGKIIDLRTAAIDLGGTSGNDTYVGTDLIAQGDKINGRDGNDTLWGGRGDDTLIGGNHDDVLYGDRGADSLDGGSGAADIATYEHSDLVRYDDKGNEFGVGVVIHTRTGGTGGDAAGDHYSGIEIFVGTNFNDTITGEDSFDLGGKAEEFRGGHGHDVLSGGAGGDTLKGRTGNDVYHADSTDVISDEEGVWDSLWATQGGRYYAAGTGIEWMGAKAGVANVWLTAGPQGNQLDGNDLDNTLEGGTGADLLIGGNGSDVYIVVSGNDVIQENGTKAEDIDTVKVSGVTGYALGANSNLENLEANGPGVIHLTGNNLRNKITGNDGYNEIRGGDNSDMIYGGGAADDLYGEDGDDHLYGGHGADIFYGGAGQDWAWYDDYTRNDNLTEGLILSLRNDGRNTGIAAGDYYHDIEVLSGTKYDDKMYANDLGNGLFGREGNDLLVGGTKDDYLDGGQDNDSINGGGGNDELIGFTGNDTLNGGEGNDILRGGLGGQDWAWYGDFTRNDGLKEGLILSLKDGTGAGDTYDDIEVLSGTNYNDKMYASDNGNGLYGRFGDDTLVGGNKNDYLDAGQDNDSVEGGGGEDELIGFTGNDTLNGGEGNDALKGGEGNDWAWYGDYTLNDASVEGLTLSLKDGKGAGDTYDSIEVLSGTRYNDKMYASDAGSGLYGQGGDDLLEGGTGSDTLEGGSGNDILKGGEGADKMKGGSGHDTYYVDDLDDVVDESDGSGTDRSLRPKPTDLVWAWSMPRSVIRRRPATGSI